MNKLRFSEVVSMAAAMSSIGVSLTLEQAGIVIGIVTALVTCTINAMYTIRRDRREERLFELQLKAGHAGDRQ